MNVVFTKSCEQMPELADESVQCVVTSPPYYGLRDYGVEGQIGMESTVAEYVERLVAVFREVRRVLRDDGTLWLNLGDAYAGSWGAQSRDGALGNRSVISARQIAAAKRTTNTGTIRDPGLKPKDLIGVPWRVALALQADGWWLRDAIIWSKPNPMPSSVTDRCTPSYEFVFMLAKSATYFADMDAVRTPLTESTLARVGQRTYDTQAGSLRANGGAKKNGAMKAVVKQDALGKRQYTGFNERYFAKSWNPHDNDSEEGNGVRPGYERVAHPLGANLRNVWEIATTRFADEHFATFPLELALRCIRIGCPEGGLVLDPFLGSGTTAEAAESIGRRWVGYEISPEYVALIRERTRQIGLFA